jgi:hypothetical protein
MRPRFRPGRTGLRTAGRSALLVALLTLLADLPSWASSLSAWRINREGSLEIRTAWCDPADVTAPLPVDVTAGTRLDLTLSHSALVADGGEAHFAVFVGDELVWEARTTLPAPAAFLAPRVALQRAHVAGEPVVVHVHNHGSNAYAIHGLRFLPP